MSFRRRSSSKRSRAVPMRRRTTYRRGRRPTRRAALGRARGYARRSGMYGRFLPNSSVELKVYDRYPAAVGLTSGSLTTVQPFLHANGGNGIAQGTNAGQRLGNRITVKSIEWCVTFDSDALTAGSFGPFMVYVVLDKQCNGVIVTTADLFAHMLDGVPTAVAAIAASNAPRNLINASRFTTISKKMFQPRDTYGITTAAETGRIQATGYKKVNIPIEYGVNAAAGTSGTIDQIKSNNIYIIAAYSPNGAIGCSVQVFTRVRYSDA